MIDFEQLIKDGENQHVEFKRNFNVDVLESLVAFANTEGGTVYIGISDKGKITGVNLNYESIQHWVNEIKSKTEPALLADANLIEIEGKKIVMFSVKEYPIKPISLQGRYYKRIRNSNHLLSTVEIANMSLSSLQLSWDSYPAYGKTLDDLDIETINKFIEKVNSNGRLTLRGGTWQENFQKLNLIKSGQPTNAAFLLFGKENIGYNVHVGRFKTPYMIIDDRMMNCNLFKAVEETMRFLISQIKVAYEITGITTQRTQIFEYPLPALREIVLNSFIHRDYTNPMDVQIKVFDNKITFFSPGELYGKQTVEALLTDEYQAYTRNKLIAEAFYLTGDIEKYGTGYTRIRSEIASYPTMKFCFEEIPSAWLVTLSYENQKTSSQTHNNELVSNSDTQVSTQVKDLILILKDNILSKSEILELHKLVHKSNKKIMELYFNPAIEQGYIEMLYPDKPHHPKQKYFLTEKGKNLLDIIQKNHESKQR